MNNRWSHTIAIDMPVGDDWVFARELKRLTGQHYHVVAGDGRAGVPLPRRLLLYTTVALRLLLHHRAMRHLVCWQQYFGLTYAWLCAMLHLRPRAQVVVMTFIYRRRGGLPGRLHYGFVRRALTGGHITRVIVYSHAEAERYTALFGTPCGLFRFAPLALDDVPQMPATDGDYFFSTGKSNRDYPLLLAAVQGSGHRLLIASDTVRSEADGVTVVGDTYGDAMLALMARSKAVVIALGDPDMSSGQLVALQAMALGKPVVATRGAALADYVEHGVTGLLVDSTPETFRQAMDSLAGDSGLRHRLGAAARERARGFSLTTLANAVITD